MTKLGLTPGVHGADNDEKNEDKKEDIKIDPKVFTVLQPTVIPVPTPVKQKPQKRNSSLCCYISKCLAIFALFVLLFATAMVIIYGADTVLQYLPSVRSTKPSIEASKTEEQPKEDSNLMMMSIPLARIMVIDGGREDSQEQNPQQNMESQEAIQIPDGRPRHPYEIEGPPMDAFNMPPMSEQSQQQQPNPLIQMFQQRLMAHIMMARMMRFRRLQQAMYEQEMMQRQAMEARWRMQQEMQQMMMARAQWAEQMRMQEMARAQQAYTEQQRQQWEAMQAQRQEAERQRAVMYWQQQMQMQQPQAQNQQQGPVGWWQTPNPSQNGWQNVPRPFMNSQGPPAGFMRPHDASPQQIVDRLTQPKPFGGNPNMQTIPPVPLPSIQDRIYQHYQQQAQNMHFDAPNRPIWTAITPTPPTPVVDGDKTTVVPNVNVTENVFKPFESNETATEAPPVIVFQDDFPKTNERTTTPEPKLNEKAPKPEEDQSEELVDIPTLFNKLFNGQLQRLVESRIIDNTPADQIVGETKDSSEVPPPQEPSVEPKESEEESPLPSPSAIPAVVPIPTESGEEEGKSMETPMVPPNGGGSSEVVPSVMTPEGQPGSTEVVPEVSPSEEAPVSVDESEPDMRRIPPHAITV